MSPVPYADGPSYSATKETHSYPGSYRSIRTVDFRNLNDGDVELRNGHYGRDEPFDHYSVDLDSIRYLTTLTRTGDSVALVVYDVFEAGVSSNSNGRAVIFELSKGHLQSIQSIEWDTHNNGPRPTWSFDPKNTTFVIRSSHYRPGDAHCCISAVDVVTFRWDGKQFNQAAVSTESLSR